MVYNICFFFWKKWQNCNFVGINRNIKAAGNHPEITAIIVYSSVTSIVIFITALLVIIIVSSTVNILITTHANLFVIIVVSFNLCVLFLGSFNPGSELILVRCSDNLGSHLDCKITSRTFDFLLNNLASFIQQCQAIRSLWCRAGHHIYRWSNQINSNRNFRCSNANTSPQGIFDRVYAFISVTRTFKISSNLDGLLGQLSLNVLQENLLGLLIETKILKKLGVCNSLLEIVIGCSLLLRLGLKVPGSLLVKSFKFIIGFESKNLSDVPSIELTALALEYFSVHLSMS